MNMRMVLLTDELAMASNQILYMSVQAFGRVWRIEIGTTSNVIALPDEYHDRNAAKASLLRLVTKLNGEQQP